MRPASPGQPVVPTLTADDLLAAIPELAEKVDVTATTISTSSSASLTMDDLLAALRWADEAVQAGAAGVVISHGTDTLEESAFLVDLMWDRPEPIVLTGAMRSSNLASPDGSANLFNAAVTAASPQARNLGVLVALNETVHLARLVRKSDSHALEAFTSPGFGPVGYVREREFERFWALDAARLILQPPSQTTVRIPLVEATWGEDGSFVSALLGLTSGDARPGGAGIDGLVVDGSGVGHVSAAFADVIEDAVAAGVPVVVSSRTDQSGTAHALYGYAGSESDLVSRGAILAGQLTGRKARLALHLMVDAGWGLDQIRSAFTRYWRGQ